MVISPQYTTIAAVGILLLGIIVGAIAARLVLPSRRQLRRLATELDALRAEHTSYRANVTQHFETTSALVANMTASYKAVYDHLAAGAQDLCDSSKTLEAGEFGSPRLVFDPRVDVARLDTETTRTAGEQPAAETERAAEASSSRGDGHDDAPVLEMTKAPTADEPATDADHARETDSDDATRPSIH